MRTGLARSATPAALPAWPLFKQWGDWAPTADGGMAKLGKKAAGRLLDGVQHDGYPSTGLPVGIEIAL